MKTLIPARVPWMVAPSAPGLTIASTEAGETIVSFVGFFDYEPASERALSVDIVDASKAAVVDPDEQSCRYQLIAVHFDTVGWFRRSPQFSDREVIRESEFDWSRIPGVIRHDEAVIDWRMRVSADWARTKICQDPNFYIVENSDWSVGSDRDVYGMKHFLILGESSFIEVLAKDYSWHSHGNVSR